MVDLTKFKKTDMWDIQLICKFPSSSVTLVEYPWFVVKSSTLENAGLGLFANRKFAKNEVIGLYTGKFLSDQEIAQKKISIYAIRSGELKQYIDPKNGIGCKQGLPYYGMALHMINDPLFFEPDVLPKPTSKTLQNMKKKINSTIFGNMLLHANRDISINEEIFMHYNIHNFDERNDGSNPSKRKRGAR
jgi:hypothetical protein